MRARWWLGSVGWALVCACGSAEEPGEASESSPTSSVGAGSSGQVGGDAGSRGSSGGGLDRGSTSDAEPAGSSSDEGLGPGPVASGDTTTGVVEAGSSGGTTPTRCDPAVSEANRAVVAMALDELFVEKDLSAIDRYWGEPYLQHNPIAESGVEPFRSIMSSFVPSPSFSYERLRTVGECDLVVVQGRYSSTGVIFDMFRVEDGKLVEHWDSDTGQASDAGGPTEVLEGDRERHRELVLEFLQAVLVDEAHDRAAEFLAPSMVVHRATGATGPSAFVDLITADGMRYREVHHVIADGNFVFTLSEGELAGTDYGFYDLFRLEGDQIVEHWDARRVVPETTQSGLGIF